MRLSIKTRIFLSIFFALAAFVVVVNLAIQSLLKNVTDREVLQAMTASVVAYQRFDEQRKALLLAQVNLIAQTAHLKATLTIPDLDKATLHYTVTQLQRNDDIALMLILSDQGDLLLNMDRQDQQITGLQDFPGVLSALEGEPYYGYWHYDNNYYRLVISPSIVGNQVAGLIVLGQQLDQPEQLTMAQEITGANVILSFSNKLYKSSRPAPAPDHNLLETALINNTGYDVTAEFVEGIPLSKWVIDGSTFYTASIPLENIAATLTLYRGDEAFLNSVTPVQIVTLLSSALTLLVGLLFSWLVSTKISRPVLNLIKATQEYGAGKFDLRVKRESVDELGDLTDAFNKMADDLQLGREQLLDKEEAEEKMRNLAYYDSLTELPNRRFFNEKLDTLIRLAAEGDYKIAVLFIDVDNFKRINDSLGHSQGDQLLKQISQRLKGCVRLNDVIATHRTEDTNIHISRLGGDEFTVILNRLDDPQSIIPVVERIKTAFNKPFVLDDREVIVTSSIGVSIAPSNGTDSDSLIKHADMAMYAAKESGKNNFKFYSTEMDKEGAGQLTLEAELRNALKNDEFTVHYQPFIDMQSMKIIGAEALVRWQHPERGIIAPGEFIQAAEEMGFIIELGKIVLEKACKQFKQWQDSGLPLVRLAVNFSVLQLTQPDVHETICNAISMSGINPNHLEIEITESILIASVEKTTNTLRNLKDIGLKISIDDFGTGYSSLSYLHNYPIDTLKIDRSFIAKISENKSQETIVTAIIAMAKSLDLTVIAEGIEDELQIAFLRENNVAIAQGFYFSKPLPSDEFYRFISCPYRQSDEKYATPSKIQIQIQTIS